MESSFDSFIDNYDDQKNIDSKYHGSKKYLDPPWQADLSDKDLREHFLSIEKKFQKDRENLSKK